MRPCLEPCCPHLTERTRCTQHQQQHDRQRNASPQRDKYRGSWQAESKRQRGEHPWCAQCGRTGDLTTDHMPGGGYQVLCRPCHNRLEGERRRS